MLRVCFACETKEVALVLEDEMQFSPQAEQREDRTGMHSVTPVVTVSVDACCRWGRELSLAWLSRNAHDDFLAADVSQTVLAPRLAGWLLGCLLRLTAVSLYVLRACWHVLY